MSINEILINDEIREKEMRVVSSDGEQLGIMSTRAAIAMAEEKGMDLCLIAPKAAPPVCKIMDYGKYRFEQAKREKESRKNQKTIEVKETRLSLNIDTHDFDTKVNQTKKFLSSGNRVKVSIRFRGREMAHSQLGYGIMQRFAEACADVGNVEKPAKLEGRSMIMFMNAKPAPTNKQQ